MSDISITFGMYLCRKLDKIPLYGEICSFSNLFVFSKRNTFKYCHIISSLGTTQLANVSEIRNWTNHVSYFLRLSLFYLYTHITYANNNQTQAKFLLYWHILFKSTSIVKRNIYQYQKTKCEHG